MLNRYIDVTKSYSLELPTQITSLGADGESSAPFDFKALIGAIYRRMWLILSGFLATFLLVACITFTQTPLYKAVSVVQLGTQERKVIEIDSVLSGLAANTAEVDTEVLVISSKSLLSRVAKKMNLVKDPEFNWTLRPQERGLGNSLQTVLGLKPPKADEFFAGMTPEAREAAIFEGTVKALKDKVKVKRVGTTYLINIEVTSESPQTSALLADAIADQYRVQQLDVKIEATRVANLYLQENVEQLRADVEAKESQIARYKAERGLDTADGTTLTEQEIAYLYSQRTALQIDMNRAKSRFEQAQAEVSAGRLGDSTVEAISNETITRLKERRADILRNLADLRTNRGANHPDVIAATNESSDIDRQIRNELGGIMESLRGDYLAKRDQVGSIDAQINRASSTLRGNSQDMVELNGLTRDMETSRDLLEQFLQRAKETRAQDQLNTPDANILATASVPDAPSSPKVLINLIIGTLLGLLLGGILAMLTEMFDTKVSSVDEVESKLGVDSIGSVPLIRGQNLLGLGSVNPADFLVENPLSAYAESIRYLRAAIAFSDLDSETKTVAICSSLPDEGKTSLTLSLGRMSAMSGSRTLVIDGDFRRRQLTESAGLKPEIGFIEHLFSAGQLADAITKDRKSMLDILPLSQSGHTPHDVFGTRAFDDLLARLRTMYDLILIDTGPLLLMAEARVIAGKSDKAILVVRWRSSNRSAVRQSLNLLKSFRADLLGITLNMVDLNRSRHHKDPGATYKAYRKYYQMEPKRSNIIWDKLLGARPQRSRPPATGTAQPRKDRRNDRA